MAKTKKSMRALAFIITVMMIACLAPTVSFAANTVTRDDIVADGNSITVGGSIEKGAELTMLAVRANAELTSLSGMSDADLEKAIMYIDQVTMGDEKYTKTFELRDSAEGNVITVFMGGTDAAMVYKSYKMITADGDKISKLPANLGVTVDKDSDAAKYTITVPADDNGIVYSATVDGADQDLTSRTFDVERPADDGNAETTLKKTVVVTATAGTATKTYTIEVLEQGAAAPAIKAEYVTLTAQAYGIAGAKVVTIAVPEAEIDPETNKIVVGGVELLYAPERRSDSKYRFVGIIRDAAANADAEAVAGVATVEEGAAAKLYYGKVSFTTSNAALTGADAAAAKRLNKNSAGFTDEQLLAFDVYGTGQITGAHAANIVRANKSGSKEQFSVIGQ